MISNTDIIADIPLQTWGAMQTWAKMSPYEEVCGVVLREGEALVFRGIDNLSPDKDSSFILPCPLPPNAVAIFHSHPHGGAFSMTDAQMCRATELPWILYSAEKFHTLLPSQVPELPLLGREWVWGVMDCYKLVQDIFASIGVCLSNYPRPSLYIDGEFVWHRDPNWNPYEEHFAAEGFVEASGAFQNYDLLLFNIDSPFPISNHAGVIVDVNRNIFFHHLYGRLSEEHIYGGYWDKKLRKRLRHKTLC